MLLIVSIAELLNQFIRNPHKTNMDYPHTYYPAEEYRLWKLKPPTPPVFEIHPINLLYPVTLY